jgi:hypothetical protein
VALLALTHLANDLESDPAAGDAMDIELPTGKEKVEELVSALESICDVSFR